jgi:Zn-dependent protease
VRSRDEEPAWVPARGGGLNDLLSWSMPFLAWPPGRPARIRFRLHLVMVLVLAVRLVTAFFPGAETGGARLSPTLALAAIAILLATVVLHEAAHLRAFRRAGGDRREILLWPFGGIEPWEVDGRRGVRVALAGLWPQVVTLLVGVPILGLSTGQWFGVAVAPPLPLGLEAIYALPDTWTRLLFLVNGTAMLVLLANLVPIPPLDAFVAVRSFASSRLGPDAGHRVAVKVGFVACGALAVAGIVAGMFSLLVFAGIGAWICHTETRRGGIAAIRAVSGGDADPGDWWKRGNVEAPEPDPPEPAERREAAIRRERAAAEESEFDAILAKIKRSGLDRLTPAERKVLERETRRRRGEPG